MADQKRYEVKQTGQARQFSPGDPNSLARYVAAAQHVTSVSSSGILNPLYLSHQQQQSLPTLHPPFSTQQLGSSPHSGRDYHPHQSHSQGLELSGGLSQRTHLVNTGLGLSLSHSPMHIPQHRRPPGQRVSLLRDIGIAGERERDRTETSVSSVLPHSFSAVSGVQSHLMTSPLMYGGRSGLSMLGGLQAAQQSMMVGSLSSQSVSPRHTAIQPPGQTARSLPAGAIHQFSGGSNQYLSSAQVTSIKTEPGLLGTVVKEEPGLSKPQMISGHYPHLLSSHSMASQPSPQLLSSSLGIKHEHQPQQQQQEKESGNQPGKEELLQAMEKVDKEISKVQLEISRLDRKKKQLEKAAKKPSQQEKPASPKKVEPKHRDLWQVIYAENKKKAEQASALLSQLGPQYEMPVYNQPCDTQVYQDNLKKNEIMRPKLLAYFQKRSQLCNIRERYLCARYDQLMAEWQKKSEKIEMSIKRKAKETKVREFFEKQFPEIRKQREQHERFSRSGTRGDTCRSEADFNEIVDGLTEQEHHEQHMRQLAVVPPMLLDRDDRRLKFINNNGLVQDPLLNYKKQQQLDHWSIQEKDIFKEKYIQHPKNFNLISSFLEKKAVSDCVLFYYLMKKTVNYKVLARKHTLKPRKPKSGRGHAQQQSAGSSGSQDMARNNQQSDKDSEMKKDSPDLMIKEEEEERIDRPPSPRITRSRNKTLNWTDEDIVMVKDGFGKHGKDFAAIARMFTNKTEHQVKNFFHNYKKKHNLDQVIADGKKKKPNEGRKTRTCAQPSESSEVPPDDELETGRPKSTEPLSSSSSSDLIEGNKKRKKETDPEIKEEVSKNYETDSSPSSAANAEKDSAPTSRGSTPVGGSTIRTRRSTAVANSTSESRSESAKRSSESSPVNEPAEKKIKKSKSANDQKQPPSPNEGKSSSLESANKESVKMETEILRGKMVGDEGKTLVTENEDEKASDTKAVPSVSEATVVPGTTTGAEAMTSVVTITSSYGVTDHMKQVDKEQQSNEARVKISKPTDSKEAVDGDSSATCSADEDANMQDVSDVNKNDKRKNMDSPYAFNEYSTDPIKLESRSQPAVTSVVGMPMKSESMRSNQPKDSRPSSTNAPQVMAQVPDEKRPQSLPPAPGVAAPTSILQMQRVNSLAIKGDARPNSTPLQIPGCHPYMSPMIMSSQHTSPYLVPNSMLYTNLVPLGREKHVVGKVPDKADFLSALTGGKGIESLTQKQSTAAPGLPGSFGGSSKRIQTIDLTKSSEVERKQQEEKISYAPKHPPYHAVSQAASSMQKDFTTHKFDPKTMQDSMGTIPHEYSQTQIAAMHDRAAVIPTGPIVPVSSLRFPMPSSSIQTSVTKESIKQTTDQATMRSVGRLHATDPIDRGHASTNVIYHKSDPTNPQLIHPAFNSSFAQGHLKFTQPPLTTSFIPTRYVSAATVASAAVRNKQGGATVVMSGDGLHQVIKPAVDVTKRQPPHAEEAISRMNDPTKKIIPISRASIVKGTPIPSESPSGSLTRTPGLEDSLPGTISPSQGLKGYQAQNSKSVPGSIVTGIPICKSHEPKLLGRPGKDVRSSGQDQSAVSGFDNRVVTEGDIRGPFGTMPMHYPGRMHAGMYQVPYPPSGVGSRGPAPSGSILAGTPVKRKKSDDSTSSLSPSANPSPFPGVVMSRDSPNIHQAPPMLRQQDRKGVRGSTQSPADFRAYSQLITGAAFEKMKKESENYSMPPEMMREHSSRSAASSPHMHHGMSSQYPSIKQEVPGSPRADEHQRRPNQPQTLMSMDQMRAAAAAGNNEMLRLSMGGAPPFQIPYSTFPPANTPELMEILHQYGASAAQNLYPIVFPGIPAYPPGLLNRMVAGSGSPNAPGSPQNVGDENMESTKKIMSQDFATAKLIMQQTGSNPGLSALGFPPGSHPLTNPGIQAPHLVVSGTTAYHPLANNPFHPGALPVDRLHFIPQHSMPPMQNATAVAAAAAAVRGLGSPFSPQYQPQSGRSSSARSPIPISPSESSRSPVHQPTNIASPDFVRQRHLSSEFHRESRPPVRDHYSPASPLSYPSPRTGSGHTSPRERSSSLSVHRQQSPSHPSQRQVITTQPTKPYYQYASASSPPNQAPYPTYPASGLSPRHSSANLPGQRHYPDIPGNTKPKRTQDHRSSPFHNKHSRTGSLDSGKQHVQEKLRPDSAGPYPRSLPQSPHIQPIMDPQRYAGSIKQEHRHSPKPQIDKKPFSIASMIGPDGSKRPGRQEEFMEQHAAWQRASPRPSVKQQPQMDMSGYPLVENRHISQAISSQVTSSHIPGSSQRPQTSFPHQPGVSFPHDLIQGQQSHLTRPSNVKKTSEEVAQISSKTPGVSNTSKDPAKDLIKNGRATMTAANLLYAIIDKNYHQSKDHNPAAQSSTVSASTSGQGDNSQVGVPKQPDGNPSTARSSNKLQVPGQGPAVKQENMGSKSGRFETEVQQPPSGIPPTLYNQFRSSILSPRAGEQESLDTARMRSASPNSGRSVRTFAQHSSDVINDLYRKTPTDNIQNTASTRSSSPQIPRSAGSSMMTEPISPPNNRLTSNKMEISKPVTQPQPAYQSPQQQQYQMPSQHQRFPPSSAQVTAQEQSAAKLNSRLAMQAAQQQQRQPLAQIPIAQPMQFPVSTSSSLEDIIRKALMNPQSESPPPDIRRLQDQQSGLIPPKDLFLTHAMHMMSMPRPAVLAKSEPELVPKSKAPDAWKEPPAASSQPPQNSGYMSALMLRQMPSTTPPQNSQAPSVQTPDNRQQFYSTQAPRSNLPTNPANQPQPESNNPSQQQCHQAPAMLPQYEALSDSD